MLTLFNIVVRMLQYKSLLLCQVPAVRIPFASSVSNDDKYNDEINAVISICFDAYYSSNIPEYLYEMWKYVVLNNHNKFLNKNNKVQYIKGALNHFLTCFC